MAEATTHRPIQPALTKKRYIELLEGWKEMGYDDQSVDALAALIKQVMHFEPDDPRRVEWKRDQIRKRAENLGVTTYVTSGRKAAYYKNKEAAKGP